jgi:molybdate/tungstate transport system substrate-binding protein
VVVAAGCSGKRKPAERVTVYAAGSLAAPMNELLRDYAAGHPAVEPALETSGSVEAVRKITDLHKTPDLLAVADASLISQLLAPRLSGEPVLFARNAMVLAYTPRSTGADRITSENWWQVIQQPGVRVGHSDPALDPAGYRALLVYQLAERYYREPGLAQRLAALTTPAYLRPKSSDLTALLQAGDLDYAWTYRSSAETAGLRYVELPDALNLSDPKLASQYAEATLRIPRPGGVHDSLTIHGEPIVFGAVVPLAAANAEAGRALLAMLLSPVGQQVLTRAGFLPINPPAEESPRQ